MLLQIRFEFVLRLGNWAHWEWSVCVLGMYSAVRGGAVRVCVTGPDRTGTGRERAWVNVSVVLCGECQKCVWKINEIFATRFWYFCMTEAKWENAIFRIAPANDMGHGHGGNGHRQPPGRCVQWPTNLMCWRFLTHTRTHAHAYVRMHTGTHTDGRTNTHPQRQTHR